MVGTLTRRVLGTLTGKYVFYGVWDLAIYFALGCIYLFI